MNNDVILYVPDKIREACMKPDTNPYVKPSSQITMPVIKTVKSERKENKKLLDLALLTVFNQRMQLKKRPLIKYLRDSTGLSSSIVCGFVNKLFKVRALEIDKKFKTKPIVIEGKNWRLRMNLI